MKMFIPYKDDVFSFPFFLSNQALYFYICEHLSVGSGQADPLVYVELK